MSNDTPSNDKCALHKTRILYVEDNDEHRRLFKMLLESSRHQYEVVAVATCGAALAYAQHDQFDLFLLDNWLPDGEGHDLCRELQKLSPQLPVIFLTAANDPKTKVAALAGGACTYLNKPLDGYTLMQEIEHVLNRAARARSQKATHCEPR